MIKLTNKAAQHITNQLSSREDAIGIKIVTKKSGCTGFAYVVDYALEINTSDIVFTDKSGIQIITNEKSLEQLKGMTVDFVKQNAINEGFEFINPNVTNECGCGESFSVA